MRREKGRVASALLQMLHCSNLIEKLSECKSSCVLGNSLRLLRNADEIDGVTLRSAVRSSTGGRARDNGWKQTHPPFLISFNTHLSNAEWRPLRSSVKHMNVYRLTACNFRGNSEAHVAKRKRTGRSEHRDGAHKWRFVSRRVCVLLQGLADMSGSAPAWGTEAGVQWISMRQRSAGVVADNTSARPRWQLVILDEARLAIVLSKTGPPLSAHKHREITMLSFISFLLEFEGSARLSQCQWVKIINTQRSGTRVGYRWD